MAVWFMRRLQGVPCEQSYQFDVDIAAGARKTRIPINDQRDDALRALARSLSLIEVQSSERPSKAVSNRPRARYNEGRNA